MFFKKYRYRKSKSVHFKRSTGTKLLLGASTEYRYRLTFKVPMPTFDNNSRKIGKEGFISPKIFTYSFINSDSNLIQSQMLTLKLFPKSNPNPNPNLNLILTPKKANEKSADEYFSFLFYLLQLENFR